MSGTSVARRTPPVSPSPSPRWTAVCALDDIVPETGVCALVGGRQIAVVRSGDAVFAVDNFDPFAQAYVLSRGIVGDRGGAPKIASPIYKQSFDLHSGVCLDDPSVAIAVYAVRVRDGQVEIAIAAPPEPADA